MARAVPPIHPLRATGGARVAERVERVEQPTLNPPPTMPRARASLPSLVPPNSDAGPAHSRSMGDISSEALRSLGSGIGLGIDLGDEREEPEELLADLGLPKSRAPSSQPIVGATGGTC